MMPEDLEILKTGEIKMPDVIRDWLKHHIGVAELSINTTDCINDYGMNVTSAWVLKQYAEWCTAPGCNYHSIYNPDVCGCKAHRQRHKLEKGYIDAGYYKDGMMHWYIQVQRKNKKE